MARFMRLLRSDNSAGDSRWGEKCVNAGCGAALSARAFGEWLETKGARSRVAAQKHGQRRGANGDANRHGGFDVCVCLVADVVVLQAIVAQLRAQAVLRVGRG